MTLFRTAPRTEALTRSHACSYKITQASTDALLRRLMKQQGSAALDNVLAARPRHRLQTCYTQIDRDAKNRPPFPDH